MRPQVKTLQEHSEYVHFTMSPHIDMLRQVRGVYPPGLGQSKFSKNVSNYQMTIKHIQQQHLKTARQNTSMQYWMCNDLTSLWSHQQFVSRKSPPGTWQSQLQVNPPYFFSLNLSSKGFILQPAMDIVYQKFTTCWRLVAVNVGKLVYFSGWPFLSREWGKFHPSTFTNWDSLGMKLPSFPTGRVSDAWGSMLAVLPWMKPWVVKKSPLKP